MTLRPDMEDHPVLDPKLPPADARFRSAEGDDMIAFDLPPRLTAIDRVAIAFGFAALAVAVVLVIWAVRTILSAIGA